MRVRAQINGGIHVLVETGKNSGEKQSGMGAGHYIGIICKPLYALYFIFAVPTEVLPGEVLST